MAEALAIDGGPKVRTKPFPPWPALGDEDVSAVADALRSGGLTQLTGGAVAAFEEAFAAWNGVPHCVATSSGTTAIHTALAALGGQREAYLATDAAPGAGHERHSVRYPKVHETPP